jgi:hypothetical protein
MFTCEKQENNKKYLELIKEICIWKIFPEE